MSDLIGKTIGQYQIVEQIGMGGMATVFKAYQPSIDRYVAIKILPSQFAQDPNFVKRFQHEAKAIAALEHPHILPVHDFGTEADRPYMVMRYVEGGTLAKLMGQSLSYEQIVRIVGNIARALNYAHQQGVVHRDIKPSNILIDQHGEVLLTDFGIAKIIEGSGATQLTGAGSILGTPAYMAPEQAGAGNVDGRSDIYSLGVVLYELLTGQPPYRAETPLAVVLMHVNDPLPPPRTIKPDIPEPLERVVLKAMAKDPNQRFQTAGDMERALRQALKEIEIAAPTAEIPKPATQIGPTPTGKPQPAARSGRSTMGPLLIGGGIVALLLCLGGGVLAALALFSSSGEVSQTTPTTGGVLQVTLPAAQTATPAPESSGTPVPGDEDIGANAITHIAGLDGEIIFEDRFDSARNGWYTGKDEDEYGLFDSEIVNGRYRLSGQAKQGVFRTEEPLNVDFDNFVLSVDATPVEQNAPFSYGLIFRADDNGDYYTFTIDEGNAFSVSALTGGEWQGLVASRRMSAIKSTGPNQLVVKAVGPSLTFYINGQEATTIKDDSLASGSIGVALELYDEGVNAAVEFDNLVVRRVDSEEPLVVENTEIEAPNVEGNAGVLFEELFDSDANGWATGKFEDEISVAEVAIRDGQYHLSVTAKQKAYVEKVLPNRQFSDFILTLEATPSDSEEFYSYGIAFRENSAGHTYTFEIGNDGLYAIFLFDGDWKILKDWSSTDALETGQTNEMIVKAIGDTFTFFLNGEELTTIKDGTLAEGKIGLILEIFEEGKSASVAFDNLAIRPAAIGE